MSRFVLALVVLMGWAATGAAEESVPELAGALLDPRASSNVKIRAATLLKRMERRAVAAVPALVRQSRYDLPEVREACLGALIGIVGASEKRRLIAGEPLVDAHPTLEAYARTWLDEIRGFETLYVARDLLKNSDPRYTGLGYAGLLRMRETAEDAAFDALPIQPTEVKSEVTALLGVTVDAFHVGEALELAQLLGPEDPAAARLVLRALAYGGAAERAAASAYADRIFIADRATPQMIDAVVDGMLDMNISKRNAAQGALARLGRPGSGIRPMVAEQLAFRVAAGSQHARGVLLAWDSAVTPLTKLALAIGNLPSGTSERLARLLRNTAADNADVEALAGWVVNPDAQTAILAARLCAMRCPPRVGDVLKVTLGWGYVVDRRVWEALEPTREQGVDAVTRYIANAAALGADRSEAKQYAAALKVVEFIGFDALDPEQLVVLMGDADDNVRAPALNALRAVGFQHLHAAVLKNLLDDREEAVRIAAAEVLGDVASMARARLPVWLADLRGNEPSVRYRAARQVEACGAFDPAFCAALVKAVGRRDMVVREALTAALERGARQGVGPVAALRGLAEDETDTTARAYARVALREFP